jgi:hypothetical protein
MHSRFKCRTKINIGKKDLDIGFGNNLLDMKPKHRQEKQTKKYNWTS